MKKKSFFSLKVKLLMLLVLLPTSMLGLYLFIATTLFKQDKLAYVFDSGLTLSRSISSQVRAEIDALYGSIRPILKGYQFESKSFTPLSKEVFNENKKMKSLIVIEQSGTEVKPSEILTQSDFKFIYKNEKIEDVLKLVKLHAVALLPAEGENLFVFAYKYFEGEETVLTALCIFESNDLGRVFQNRGGIGNYLVDNNGHVILGQDLIKKDIDFSTAQFFQSLKEKDLPEGTTEGRSEEDVPVLISYSKVGIAGFIIISRINKDIAFKALNVLLRKSILFFIALISLSFIVSIIASNTLTSRLRVLAGAVGEVSKGNFNIKVDEGSGDEVGHLAFSFNLMAQHISKLLGELKEYSENLEKMVEQRTLELKKANQFVKAMIDSLGQGLFVFDKDAKAMPIYTKACESIFHMAPKDKGIWEIFKLGEKTVNSLKKWALTLFKQMIPFKDMAKLGPTVIDTEEGKHIEIEYHPMMEEKKLVGVVTVATDKTKEFRAELKAKENEEYTNMVLKIVKNKKQFISFINESRHMLKTVEDILNSDADIELAPILLQLHSLKGGAGVFSVQDLRQSVHDVETWFGQYKESDPNELRKLVPQFNEKINFLKNMLETRIQEFSSFLGQSIIDGQSRLELKIDNLRKFGDELKKSGNDKLYYEYVDQFVKEPIVNYLVGYSDLVVEHAKKRQKVMNPINFKGGDLRIDAKAYGDLFSTLVHPFLNAIDHGLEAPSERKKIGKTENGQITVEIKDELVKNKKYLRITISDDGRGIDPSKIREKLLKNGMPEDKIEKDDYQVIQHVFDTSFSTAQEVSLTSGRGVGMGALKHAVENLGGTVDVKSKFGEGSNVRLLVPYF